MTTAARRLLTEPRLRGPLTPRFKVVEASVATQDEPEAEPASPSDEEVVVDPNVELRRLRRTLGCFAQGVVVVTASSTDGIHGAATGSLTSLSLEPPLVLVAIGNSAGIAPLLRAERLFGISVLARHQNVVARHFSGERDGHITFDYDLGVPLIADALAGMVCELEDAFEAYGYSFFVGRIREHDRRQGTPLIHFGRQRVCAEATVLPEDLGKEGVEIDAAFATGACEVAGLQTFADLSV